MKQIDTDGNLAALRQYEAEQSRKDIVDAISEQVREDVITAALKDEGTDLVADAMVDCWHKSRKGFDSKLLAALVDIALHPDSDSHDPRYAARAAPRHDLVADLIRDYIAKEYAIQIEEETEAALDRL